MPGGEFSRPDRRQRRGKRLHQSRLHRLFPDAGKERLELSFRLEADRMRHLLLKPEGREQGSSGGDRGTPAAPKTSPVTDQRGGSTPPPTSPAPTVTRSSAGCRTSGSLLDDLKHWYQQWYAPNNAVLVVVGDGPTGSRFGPKHFGPLPPSELTPPKPAENYRN